MAANIIKRFNQISTLGNYLIKQKTADLILCPTIDKDKVYIYEFERRSESLIPHDKRQVVLS